MKSQRRGAWLRRLFTRHLYNQRGFTLSEAIVGLSIILVASVGGVGLFSRAQQTGGETKHITEATYIAKSKIEQIKATDFEYITTSFPDGVVTPLVGSILPGSPTWTVTYPDGIFADMLKITVTISWEENGQTKSVQLSTMVVEV